MRRDKRLIFFFTVVALISGGLVGIHLATATGPGIQVVRRAVPAGPDGSFTLQFVGDTMLGAEGLPTIRRHGYFWPFRRVRSAIDADYSIVNVETAITTIKKPFNPAKEYYYPTNPSAAAALSRAGFDAGNLGNNHAMDAGPAGLADTVTHLTEAGLTTFGAGPSIAQAERPLILASSAGTVGVVSLGESFGSSVTATETQAGTIAMDPETVQRGYDLAKAAGADWVIAYVHWGDNYEPVNRLQRYWARMLAAAGYDLVIGAGPHISQFVRVIDSVPVVYSLGNFVFTTPGSFENFDNAGLGLIADVQFRRGEDPRLSLRCVAANNQVVDYQPWLCNTKRAAQFLPKLNSRLTVLDGSGMLP